MNKREMKRELKRLIDFDGEIVDDEFNETKYKSAYLGSYMSLDPCGRYHHFLSPNGVTKKCEAFWERLETAADEIDCWIESGEGDPTDIYLCQSVDEDTEEA